MVSIPEMRKAIVALISAIVVVIAMFVPQITEYVSPEVIGAIGAVVVGIITYFVPNKPPAE